MSYFTDKELTKEDVMESLTLKMTSTNSIECDGCRITRAEYEIIMEELNKERKKR